MNQMQSIKTQNKWLSFSSNATKRLLDPSILRVSSFYLQTQSEEQLSFSLAWISFLGVKLSITKWHSKTWMNQLDSRIQFQVGIASWVVLWAASKDQHIKPPSGPLSPKPTKSQTLWCTKTQALSSSNSQTKTFSNKLRKDNWLKILTS